MNSRDYVGMCPVDVIDTRLDEASALADLMAEVENEALQERTINWLGMLMQDLLDDIRDARNRIWEDEIASRCSGSVVSLEGWKSRQG